MDLPIDTSTLHCVVTEPCAPRLDRETGAQRTDRTTGLGIWDTGLLVGDGTQATPLRVKTFSENSAPQMAPVMVAGLRLTMLTINGDVVQYFTAEEIRPAATSGEWGPAPAAAPATVRAAGTASDQGPAQGSGQGSGQGSAPGKGAASSSAGAGSGGSPGSRSGGSAGKAGA